MSAQSKPVTLSIDCMGGDHGVSVIVPACAQFAQRNPHTHLLLVGQEDILRATWKQQPQTASVPETQITFVPASQVVAMDDSVEVALRHRKNSSMRIAIEQVRHKKADAAVSAGNTGALMAVARYLLKTMRGIDRPAIAFQLPNTHGGATTVLDLGANVDCDAVHLLQFAVMGSALAGVLDDKEYPTVGLLNIGEEAIKGSEVIKQARVLLSQAAESDHLNFYGNVEGDDIFKGTTDVVVCDGFVGNVALKTSEGLATMVAHFLKQEFTRNIFTKLLALAASPVLRAFKRRVDHRRYNGAALLGLRGLVFKSHGSSDTLAFAHALQRAHDAASNQLIQCLQNRIERAGSLLTDNNNAACSIDKL